jgi:hypothetical protein
VDEKRPVSDTYGCWAFMASVLMVSAILTLLLLAIGYAHAQDTVAVIQPANSPVDWFSAAIKGVGWPGAALGIAWKLIDFMGKWLDNTKGRIPINVSVRHKYHGEEDTQPINYQPLGKHK